MFKRKKNQHHHKKYKQKKVIINKNNKRIKKFPPKFSYYFNDKLGTCYLKISKLFFKNLLATFYFKICFVINLK